MSIYLIRHGKTLANEQRLYCGSTDLPLSDAGIQELQRLRYDISPTYFVTSGMRRTDETLKLLFGNVEYRADPRLREVNFGRFEMHSYMELKDLPEYQTWLEGNNEANVPPEGESGYQMRSRVLEAFAELPDDTVVITHGGVIAAIMDHLFGQEGKSRYEWQPKNGCGYRIGNGSYEAIG